MKERPIIFSADSVRAVLDGRKTQTRRVVSPRTVTWLGSNAGGLDSEAEHCPHGVPGDRLWVREALRLGEGSWAYAADDRAVTLPSNHPSVPLMFSWAHHKTGERCSSIHMPRWASRIDLEVADVRVERLQDITEEDARAEGLEPAYFSEAWACMRKDGSAFDALGEPTEEMRRELVACIHKPRELMHDARESYRLAWYRINGKRAPWDSNPWVWRIEFRRINP